MAVRRVLPWWAFAAGLLLTVFYLEGKLPTALDLPLAFLSFLLVALGWRGRRWLLLLTAVLFFFLPLFWHYAAVSVWPWLLLFGVGNLWLAWLVWGFIRERYLPPDPLSLTLGRIDGVLPQRLELGGQDRFLHVHVLGPTGAGKSEGVLWPMLAQDVERPVGLTLVDPKGDLAERLVAAASRQGRTVAVLGAGSEMGWNPLAGPAAAAAETAAYALEGVLPSEHGFFQTLSETLLKMSVLAVKEGLGETVHLSDVLRFLSDEDERRRILLRVRSAATLEFFRQQYASWTKKARDEYTMGLRNALSDLLSHPEVRAILSRDDVDLRHHLREGSVLVVSLPMAAFGAAGRLLGSFLLASLVEAALSRGPDEPPHFLYIDEFQEFANRRFQDFLAMARSYRVGAVLAHQNLTQLTPELRSAVLANARNRIVLGGLAMEDLEHMREVLGRRVRAVHEGGSTRITLAPKYDPFMVRQLPRGKALIQTVARGQVQEPFIVRLPPLSMS